MDSRRHEVMKAVLLNSGDKVEDSGDGFYLRMNHTIFNEQNGTWLSGNAYIDDEMPLDIQLGTGHLNVFRAYQQFSAGQQSPTSSVDNMGWDYGTLESKSHKEAHRDTEAQRIARYG